MTNLNLAQEHEANEDENGKKFLDEQESQDEDGNAVTKIEYTRVPFNIDEFNIEFDTNNPPIEIPNEVADHFDNDFDLPYSPPDLSAEWLIALSRQEKLYETQ